MDVDKVISGSSPPLDKSDTFVNASKDFVSGARAVGYVDAPQFLGQVPPDAKQFIDGYLTPVGPVTASVRIDKAGALLKLMGRFKGTQLPKAIQPPVKLDIVNRLPAETFAYIAFTSKGTEKGADVQKRLVDQVKGADPSSAASIEQNLAQMEAEIGVSLAKLIDGLGGQGVLGVAAPQGFRYDPARGTDQMSDFAAYAAFQLSDEATFKTALTNIRAKLGPMVEREASIEEVPGGFLLTPKSGTPPIVVQIQIADKTLIIAGGGKALTAQCIASLTTKSGALANSPAHAAAIKALSSDGHALMWTDAGRIGDTVVKAPGVQEMLDAAGIDISKFKLTGDERITSALSAKLEMHDDVWTLDMEALNAPALGSFGAIGAMLSHSALQGLDTPPALDPSALPPGSLPPGVDPAMLEKLEKLQQSGALGRVHADATPSAVPLTPTAAPHVTATAAPKVTATAAPKVTATAAPKATATAAPKATATAAPKTTATAAPKATATAVPKATATAAPKAGSAPAPH
jgi:hypothetical protein